MGNDESGGIGIFGGTFDPIHVGHKAIAMAVRELFGLSSVFIVPVFRSPLRVDTNAFADSEARLTMSHLATVDETWLFVDPVEIERGRKDSLPSYTIDTLEHFRVLFPNSPLTLVVGSDNVAFHKWRRVEEFTGYLSRIAVVSRAGYEEEADRNLAQVSEEFPALAELVEFLRIAPIPISSTVIRESLRNGVVPSRFLNPLVELYIVKYGLYGLKGEKS